MITEDLTLQISNVFNDTGAYRELKRLLFVSNTLGRYEIEELVDKLEDFITQEIQEIIDER
tara:strand:+ start:307 stop:489 length:183 start_codon:yes stop_codon:yes gene_type:complete